MEMVFSIEVTLTCCLDSKQSVVWTLIMDLEDKVEEMSRIINASSRLGNCEVCDSNLAKYTCPECEVKTCCLECVKIHRKELDCSGIRNKVKFKSLKKMNNLDFQSDYLLLESTIRSVHGLVSKGKALSKSNLYSLTRMKIKGAANKRNIALHYLPKTFKKHKENSTYYNWKSDLLYWKVEWIFVEAGMLAVVDERVPEQELISNLINKYIDSKQCSTGLRKNLSPYHEVDKDIIKVLLKVEKYNEKKFYEVDMNDSLMESLSQQSIIEHPTFYLIFETSSSDYDIVKRDVNRSSKFSNNYKGTNLLFNAEEY